MTKIKSLPVVSKEEIDQAIKDMQMPKALWKRYREAMTTRSRTKMIDTYCVTECMGGCDGYREAVRDCKRRACPFWRVRPYARQEDE